MGLLSGAAGVSTLGAACAREKKFHFDGLDRSFSFSNLPFFDDRSQLPSSFTESLRVLEILRLRVRLRDPSIGSTVRDVRRAAKVGRNDLFESSSPSEDLLDTVFAGNPPRVVFGIAEGKSLGRDLLSAGSAVMLVVLPIGCLKIRCEISRLVLLLMGSGLRVNSELLPAPRSITGLSLLRKKSSISPLVVLVMLLLRVEGV